MKGIPHCVFWNFSQLMPQPVRMVEVISRRSHYVVLFVHNSNGTGCSHLATHGYIKVDAADMKVQYLHNCYMKPWK